MKKGKKFQIPDKEYRWILSVLKRSLLRFPELESFDDDELRKLIIFWDDIFTRWLQKFYWPLGIEVGHKPESKTKPIIFRKLLGQKVKAPNPLRLYKIKSNQLRNIIDTYGREGLINDYLKKRLTQLSDTSD